MKTENLPAPALAALFLALAALFLLAACITTETTDARQITAHLAVTYATMKVVERNPAYGPRIATIARDVRQVAGGDKAATVAMLAELIRAEVRWKSLSPADAMLANVLIDEVVQQLTARLGPGKLEGDKLLIVAEVATWIETAAQAQPVPN